MTTVRTFFKKKRNHLRKSLSDDNVIFRVVSNHRGHVCRTKTKSLSTLQSDEFVSLYKKLISCKKMAADIVT